jgi:hypothetical protein
VSMGVSLTRWPVQRAAYTCLPWIPYQAMQRGGMWDDDFLTTGTVRYLDRQGGGLALKAKLH